MLVFKGDIIQKSEDENKTPHEWLFAQSLYGVISDADITDGYYFIFYRPFKNKVKYFLHKIGICKA